MDEEFKVALNDVDFCLKLREKGYLNIFTPFAELFHYESQSRGRDDDSANKTNGERYEKECARFREKWKKHLEKGDPYFNVNFSLDYSNYVIGGGSIASIISSNMAADFGRYRLSTARPSGLLMCAL